MSRFLLDTNIMSSLINDRGQSPVLRRIAQAGDDRVCTSVIVAAEIRYGVAKRASIKLAESAERILGALPVLAFEPPAAKTYGDIRSDLERRGLMIGANDLLIAAQCLSLDLVLVTNNRREFERVRDLKIEDWLT
ncbi:type II toxin-antitoxin system VapC family toxin [Methylobacterium sp. Leaf466]|uniref:type II toxin-antitoxin system VapC family toxin n=1 Tax=Methylobacterium sp. Leaf466 TaxID=1736386 RepID=UPI0006FDA4EF|nr:type II toxin-antitoxin system VapC family toxin [Methylobacterium sp. Leaf466]KQT78762.1 transcriptional regulator [Methylobacterium sp. Leaf466]